MKNILIGGVAKSGKSRLATELCKRYNYNHIPVDYFASSFKHNFPELGITSDIIIDEKSSKLLAQFLYRFISIVETNDEEFFIVDTAHIYPHDIVKYLNPDKWDIYYLGYPSINACDKLKEVKQHIKDGWIIKKNDEELLKIFEKLIVISNKIEKECKNNNIKFIDTSNNDILELLEIKG